MDALTGSILRKLLGEVGNPALEEDICDLIHGIEAAHARKVANLEKELRAALSQAEGAVTK